MAFPRLVLRAPRTPVFDPAKVSGALDVSAAELEGDIKENIAVNNPKAAGRTYRMRSILRKPTRATRGIGLRRERRGNRLIVGAIFHRSSAKGQSPAIWSGRLINSILATRLAQFVRRVATSVRYALPLDDPAGLNRPFFMSRVRLYKARFLENMRRAMFEE